MQSTKYNTHSHLYLKMYEQLSNFILDAYFIQNVCFKRNLTTPQPKVTKSSPPTNKNSNNNNNNQR